MARSKRRKLPKKPAETARLTGDEVIETVFGKDAQEELKRQAVSNDAKPRKDYRTPDNYGKKPGPKPSHDLI